MLAVVDLVALTLLPVWRWRSVVQQLRAGRPPTDILRQHCDDRARRPRTLEQRAFADDVEQLRARASAALDRAAALGLQAVVWTDPAYPTALAALIDPPPVLWLRGCPAALQR